MKSWHLMSEPERAAAADYVFHHATELDLQRLRKITSWREEDGPLPLNLPQWAMMIFRRSAPDDSGN